MSKASPIVVFDTTVNLDQDGRFSLNDIHKAAKSKGLATDSQRPGAFLRNKDVQKYIDELKKHASNSCALVAITRGKNGRSYAHKTIAVAYLVWLGGIDASIKLLETIENLDYLLKALQDFEVPDDLHDMYVYAIREKDTGHIKLGISKNPRARLTQLQTGNSSELELVAYRRAENRFRDEQAIHADADAYRLRGEWFTSGAEEFLQ